MAQRLWLVVALLLLLTACGGGGTNTSNTTTSSASGSNSTSSSTGSNSTPTGSSTTGSSSGTGSTNSSTGIAIKHVVVVVFENADYSDVIGSSAMPYFNQLTTQYSLAAQFYAVTHPSLGNYFWMTAGQDPSALAQNPNGDPDQYTGTVSGDNVASEITKAGMSWKVYAQSLPSTGYTGTDVYPYFKHHNPFVYFDSVLGDPTQLANIVDFSQLGGDIGSGSLPAYSFIVPDAIHDGHDCPNGSDASNCAITDRLAEVEGFLKNELAPLLTNSAIMANTVVVLTFDESETDDTMGGGHIPVAILGGPVKTAYQSNDTYQFPSLLRFSLQSLGVNTYPGAAANAAPMTEFLK